MINHLLLTLEHASCKGLTVLGYVLNRVAPEGSLADDTNREVLANLTRSCLASCRFVSGGRSLNGFLIDLFEREFALGLIEPVLSRPGAE